MESKSGGNEPARRFAFSWADEVEREEREQQQNEQPPRREEKGERVKANPFGAARPREVVLAEKGVDWRARDRELDASHSTAPCCRTRSQGKRGATTAPAPPTPRRRQADSTTPMCHRKINAPPVWYSGAWGSKRKCAGDVPARQVRPVADQGRRVFGELNIGEGGSSSCWSSKKSCNSAGTEGTGARKLAAADGRNRDDSRVPVMAGMQSGESGVGDKRNLRGGGRWGRTRPRSSKLCYSRYYYCCDD